MVVYQCKAVFAGGGSALRMVHQPALTPCAMAPGVGKTAIVEGLAQRIVNGDVPSTLRPMRVISLDMSALVAGTKYRGEFEERIQNVLKEVTEAKNIILFIDEIHLVRAAAQSQFCVANQLSSLLKSTAWSCLAQIKALSLP